MKNVLVSDGILPFYDRLTVVIALGSNLVVSFNGRRHRLPTAVFRFALVGIFLKISPIFRKKLFPWW